jgi:hypothetical protein
VASIWDYLGLSLDDLPIRTRPSKLPWADDAAESSEARMISGASGEFGNAISCIPFQAYKSTLQRNPATAQAQTPHRPLPPPNTRLQTRRNEVLQSPPLHPFLRLCSPHGRIPAFVLQAHPHSYRKTNAEAVQPESSTHERSRCRSPPTLQACREQPPSPLEESRKFPSYPSTTWSTSTHKLLLGLLSLLTHIERRNFLHLVSSSNMTGSAAFRHFHLSSTNLCVFNLPMTNYCAINLPFPLPTALPRSHLVPPSPSRIPGPLDLLSNCFPVLRLLRRLYISYTYTSRRFLLSIDVTYSPC